jgi:hypothetical protein
MDLTAVRLPEPLPQQVPILASRARRKVLRAGRRFSKSRTAMLAAIDGHGPRDEAGVPALPGVLQGWDVVWIAKDYPQLSTVMWREEFIPRFKHLPFVNMNENEMRISVQGLGNLYLRPETAINGIRGIGKRLKGVILDEAAFYDLEATLRDVVLPALLDNEGWLIIMSTTNVGLDGNAAKRVPSYFNVLCDQIRRGERSGEWQEFHGTAYDNPRLSRAAIDELVGEYEPGSVSLRQEVYAELVEDAGRFYTITADPHLVSPADLPAQIPAWWEVWGAFDWGYAHWAVFGLFVKREGAVFLWDTYWARQSQDDDLASGVVALCAEHGVPHRSVVVYAGHDCWQKSTARGASGVTTADVFAKAGVPMQRADIDKTNGARAMRRALAHADGQRARGFYIVDRAPRPGEVEVHGMSGNRRVYEQLKATMPDPNDVNKPLKVDADANGRGGDDGTDMTRYGVATRYRDVPDPTPPPPTSAWQPEILAAEVATRRVNVQRVPKPVLVDPAYGEW